MKCENKFYSRGDWGFGDEQKIKYNVCLPFPSNLNGYQSRLVSFPSHWNWWRQTFSTFFESKVFYPLKKFFTPILPHTFSLWLLFNICYYLSNIPSYITSIKYRMFVKVFYPFLIFLKSFLPHIWIENGLKVWRREKGMFILEKMIVCLDTDIWGRFFDLSCESDNVNEVFEKMVTFQVKIES